MNILMVEQGSPEWWDAKVGSIGGTRFGNVISTKKKQTNINPCKREAKWLLRTRRLRKRRYAIRD